MPIEQGKYEAANGDHHIVAQQRVKATKADVFDIPAREVTQLSVKPVVEHIFGCQLDGDHVGEEHTDEEHKETGCELPIGLVGRGQLTPDLVSVPVEQIFHGPSLRKGDENHGNQAGFVGKEEQPASDPQGGGPQCAQEQGSFAEGIQCIKPSFQVHRALVKVVLDLSLPTNADRLWVADDASDRSCT